MIKKIIYTKYALNCFKVISLLCALMLLFTIIHTSYFYIIPFFKTGETFPFYEFFYTIFNAIVFGCCFFLFFFPQKFGITSFIAFCYSAMIIPFEQENYMGIMMYFLGIALLFVRGLMRKHKKIKITIITVAFILLQFSNIRFGFKSFIRYCIISAGGILVLALYTFIVYAYNHNFLIHEDKKLNLASYNRLNERDLKILQKIQAGTKYSVIAKEMNMSEGYLKNRLHLVFTIMEVGDKQGFLSFYDDYELFFDPETAIPVPNQL